MVFVSMTNSPLFIEMAELGIFYSEFHMKAGPQLLYQAPKG